MVEVWKDIDGYENLYQVSNHEYLQRYIDFINKYDVKYFFELDIDAVVGYVLVLVGCS